MFKSEGFLGTGASLGSDLTLIVQIVFFLILTIGVIAQRRRKYRWHDWLQTSVVVLNFFFIIFIMVASFREQEVASTLPKRPTDAYYLTVAIHAGLGLITQAMATYGMLAGHKILPRKIGRLRYWMWATYGFWTITVLFGMTTYYIWYLRESGEVVNIAEVDFGGAEAETGGEGDGPRIQRSLLQNFAFEPQQLTVVEGTTVVWINQDGAPHNVTFDDGSVASDNFFQGEAFELTFDQTGTFPIYCTLHGNPGNGMAGTVRVVEATEANVAEVAQQSPPAVMPPAPTPAPVVPPAPVSLIEPPSPSDTVAGILAFRDNLAASDSVLLAMSGVERPPEGMTFHAWLTRSDNQVLDIGLVEPDNNGNLIYTYQDPGRQNLLAQYDGVQVTLEPVSGDDPNPGEVVFSGRQAAKASEQIRLILAKADTPQGFGLGVAARRQAEELIRHAQYLQLALDLGSIADAQRHAEHILNVLAGENGELYGDWDGAHGIQNPGDGFGIIRYINEMKATANLAAQASDATRAITTHAGHVDIATNSALEWAAVIGDAAKAVVEADSVAAIGPQVETINVFGRRLLVGEDTNGDGSISLVEGGIFIAYQHAQYMGAIGIIGGAGAAVVDPLPVGPGGLETQLATGEVTVQMFDFAYDLPSLTVPAGTTVRFVNVGQSQHSATADDRSWDTGLLSPGGEMSIMFDEPGFFPYYSLLYGTRGGVGMAGSITVVEAGAGVIEIPTPAATATPVVNLSGQEFSLEMLDFTYSSLELVVSVNSVVTFFNTGEFKHSATADDGSWDTTLLDNGQQSTLTFDTPGVYPYYCTLHGAPGGSGMSGTIVVEEP